MVQGGVMANASHKNLGAGTQGKGAGVGAMTDLPDGLLEENMVLSNRDKASHSDQRGLDSKTVQTEQFHDHSANHEIDVTLEPGTLGQGASAPNTNTSHAESGLKK
jgi:hypothetical protein